MTALEERTLRFIMGYMDAHVDERGVRQPPHRHNLTERGTGQHVEGLRRKGYICFQGSATVYPTAKAERWWKENKHEVTNRGARQ